LTAPRSASPTLSLAAHLQQRARRVGLAASFPVSADCADSIGDALMTLVARASEAGLDPELELRAAARRFADLVREREQTGGVIASAIARTANF
jgi:XTP/dITP diphosphohydrolase